MAEPEIPNLWAAGSIPAPRATWGCKGFDPNRDWSYQEMEQWFDPRKGRDVWSSVYDHCPMAWLTDEVNVRRYYHIVQSTTS